MVKDGIDDYCRITYHVIPVGRWVLQGYDDELSLTFVFNDYKQYKTFINI